MSENCCTQTYTYLQNLVLAPGASFQKIEGPTIGTVPEQYLHYEPMSSIH